MDEKINEKGGGFMQDWSYLISFATSCVITVFVIIAALVVFLNIINRLVPKLHAKLTKGRK